MTAATGPSTAAALPSALFVFSVLYTARQLSTPPTPTSNPKSPFLLHVALTPQLLSILALYLPLPRWQSRLIFLPPLFATYYTLLGTGTPSVAPSYAIGTYVAVHCYRSLELLVFRDPYTFTWKHTTPPTPYTGSLWQIIDLLLSLRNTNWTHTVRDPDPDPRGKPQWLLRRTIRALALYAWLDILCWYMRSVDSSFFVPSGPYQPPWTSAPPQGLPALPAHPLVRAAYQTLLHTFRTVLSASALYAVISGAYTACALLSVSLGSSSPDLWPDAFGSASGGAFGHGVAGFWGRGWHGLFRSIFTAPVDWLGGPRHAVAMLVVPFLLSAALHAAGAWTSAYGGVGCAAFFGLQPLAIVLERRLFPAPGMPRYLWTVLWLVATSYAFFEEYRWGGLWTTEPIPFSVIRWASGEGGWVAAYARPWARWATVEEGGWVGRWAVVLL